jgi:hypothetical protein
VLQGSVSAQGKTLLGQGYRQPTATANLSYRHNITPALALVMNVTDVFNSNKTETITDNELLKETNVRRYDGRVAYIGLSYRLGGFASVPDRRGPAGRPGPGPGRGGRSGDGGEGGFTRPE